MTLNKEQFRNQFRYGPIDFGDFTPTYDSTMYGYKIYRALQLLVLEDEGQFYTVRLQ